MSFSAGPWSVCHEQCKRFMHWGLYLTPASGQVVFSIVRELSLFPLYRREVWSRATIYAWNIISIWHLHDQAREFPWATRKCRQLDTTSPGTALLFWPTFVHAISWSPCPPTTTTWPSNSVHCRSLPVQISRAEVWYAIIMSHFNRHRLPSNILWLMSLVRRVVLSNCY